MAASKQASKQANIHTHVRNAVPLVWGSLRLAPIRPITSKTSEMIHHHGASLSKQQTADLLPYHGTQQDLSLSTV